MAESSFLAAVENAFRPKKDTTPSTDYGLRNDGTKKGTGWLGELKLPNGGVATEYTMQSNAVMRDGKRIDFPTLVPTLSEDEVRLMVTDIIPNKKDAPEHIIQKAIQHARGQLGKNRSVFAPPVKPAPPAFGGRGRPV